MIVVVVAVRVRGVRRLGAAGNDGERSQRRGEDEERRDSADDPAVPRRRFADGEIRRCDHPLIVMSTVFAVAVVAVLVVFSMIADEKPVVDVFCGVRIRFRLARGVVRPFILYAENGARGEA